MRRVQSGNWIKAGLVTPLLESLASERAARWTVAVLLSVDLMGLPSVLEAESRSAVGTLVVQVAAASSVERQNDDIIIKVRLTPGVAANLWGGKSCAAVGDDFQIITASGTYTVPLAQIMSRAKAEGDEEGFICLQTSDGALHSSLAVRRGAPHPGATALRRLSPPNRKTSARWL